jgi:hypothetical protein
MPDTFDEVLGLEEQFYGDGYKQGLADGVKAGRVEGRTFGLEKGFEKYIESGKLHGRAVIWANRISRIQEKPLSSNNAPLIAEQQPTTSEAPSSWPPKIPPFPPNARLAKNIKVLYALAESDSLSTENSEEAVSDFDDRFKRAQAKVKIIERTAGESKSDSGDVNKNEGIKDGSIEDVSVLTARH